jgi:hypothetical protein
LNEIEPSKQRGAPYSIGDDVCNGSLKKTGIKKPPPTPRFPDGVPVTLRDIFRSFIV